MSLLDRLRLLLTVTLNDLFGEGEPRAPAATIPSTGEDVVTEAQAQLEQLKAIQIQATLQHKRVELEWQAAQQQARALDAEADAAVSAGKEELARSRLEALARVQTRIAELNEQRLASDALAGQLDGEMRRMQAQFDRVRQKAADLERRRRSVQAQEELAQAQRELRKKVTGLRDTLQAQEEQLARQEDRLAARRELEQVRNEVHQE